MGFRGLKLLQPFIPPPPPPLPPIFCPVSPSQHWCHVTPKHGNVTSTVGDYVAASNFSVLNIPSSTTAAATNRPIIPAAFVIFLSCQVEVHSASNLANSLASSSWCHASTTPGFL